MANEIRPIFAATEVENTRDLARPRRVVFATPSAVENAGAPTVMMQINPTGATGTEIFGGYLSEEYLNDLRGDAAADIYDKMRRSDPKVRMSLNAVKNPIRSAVWRVEKASDPSIVNADKQRDLIDFILFQDLGKSWKHFLTEALSYVDFGHSVFEIVHKLVRNHPKHGTFVGLSQLGFRSQRTIQAWNIDKQTGALESVEQLAYGDAAPHSAPQRIKADFALIFSLDREGDNFEGVSMLRPAYGAWLRKQVFLKLMAIGTEKNAVPTVMLKVPAGKENLPEFTYAIDAVKRYTSHQSNYISYPEGWEITTTANNFDASKVQAAIDAENREIVNALMANFLELGQSGSGSYALSADLSDFFLSGIEHIAEALADEINRKLIPNLIQLNFGPQTEYPRLRVSGISDKAGKELAEVLSILAKGQIVTPDNKLEAWAREAYGLPKFEGEGVRKVTPDPVGPPPAPMDPTATLAEPTRAQFAEPSAQIDKGADELKPLMQDAIRRIGNPAVVRLMASARAATESTRIDSVKGLTFTGVAEYKAELVAALAAIATRALAQARREVPSKSKVKLSESESNVRLSEYDRLPAAIRKKIDAQAALLTESQMADLRKVISFQYVNSIETSRDLTLLEAELLASVDKVAEGASLNAASVNLASVVTNTSRNVFFFEPDVAATIESMTFRNPDPVTEVCKNLNGRTFDLSDPGVQRYAPPLHHLCKSYLEPNLVGARNNPGVSGAGLRPVGSENQIERMEKQITLAETCCAPPTARRVTFAALSDDGECPPESTEHEGEFNALFRQVLLTLAEAAPSPNLQSVIVKKSAAPELAAARAFAREVVPDADLSKVEETDLSYRFRQKSAGRFRRLRTKQIATNGVSLVVGPLI